MIAPCRDSFILIVDVFAIVNPISGAGMDSDVAGKRVALLRAELERRSLASSIHLTEGAGHARELAEIAVAAGALLVLVWGGDGTVNEAAGALINSRTALGVIPAGSGNGFAGALAIPRRPEAALDKALSSPARPIDVGRFGERPFLNVAGIGFDARVARLFNQRARGSRGRWPYVVIGVREGCRYRAREYRIDLDGERSVRRALLMVFANGTEFGMGARIAPAARLDDGWLDACLVGDRGVFHRFWDVRHLALTSVERAPGVQVRRVRHARIDADEPLEYHVDGEPGIVDPPVEVAILPGALRVQA